MTGISRWQTRGRTGRGLSRTIWIACAVCAAVLAVCALVGCDGRTGKATEASPQLADASIAAGSDLTEAGQYVEVRLTFDAPVQADGDVSKDFNVKLNGDAVDSKTVALSATVCDGDVVVRLQPTSAADGRSTSVYFAMYEGQLSISPSDSAGVLPHVLAEGDQDTSPAGDSCAVMTAPVCFSIPSGVRFATVQTVAGNTATGTCAQTTIQVTQFAQLRCVTWIGLSFEGQVPCNRYGAAPYTVEDTEDGTLTVKHNHLFLRDTQRGCAADLAAAIQNAWGSKVTAEAQGDTVVITAAAPVDGQVIQPVIFEGRYDDGKA